MRHGKAAAIKSKYETILTAPAAKTKRSIASRKITTLVNCKSIAALWPLQGEVEARQTLKDARVIPNNYSRSSPAARSEDFLDTYMTMVRLEGDESLSMDTTSLKRWAER